MRATAATPRARTGEAVEQEKSYALHAAAELVEKVAALQAALPESMLDDWLDHLDRMFRASFPETLIATWRTHRLDVFAHLREPELRSPHLTDKQRARYFEVLDGASRFDVCGCGLLRGGLLRNHGARPGPV